ncbi:MAG: tRNA (guanosine(46)-N7)-methyltransferase TrmB [Acidiferrobacterales bacterium]
MTRSNVTASERPRPVRQVRSYVRREGRMTRAQRRALHQLWPRYGIDAQGGLLQFDQLFARRAPVYLEIGFGNGEALCELASAHPQNNYLGIEVYRPGVGSLLLKLEQYALTNVRVICADAAAALSHRIPCDSLDAIYLFFPDPWPKKRHHKRRLVQFDFLEQVTARLKPGGYFHVATDWEDYATHVLAVAACVPALSNIAGGRHYARRPDYRCRTRFEHRGQQLRHSIRDLVFERRR